VEALAEHRILGSDADRAATGMAVGAEGRIEADLGRKVGHALDMLVAIEGHEHRMANGDRIGAKRQSLGDIAAIANTTGINERDLALLAELIDGAARLADRGDAG